MRSLVLTSIFFLLIRICGAQVLSYSQNHIGIATHPYKIIGQVKNNIIVWYVKQGQYKQSVILVYDDKMHLIRKVQTDILKSSIDPVPNFFCSRDSFYVAYQNQVGANWKYMLAGFDESANHSSTYVLDSLHNTNANDSLSYDFIQSDDNRTLCFSKIVVNANYHAIKFECTFFDKKNITTDTFFLPFDEVHEKLIDISLNNNKNVVLLKTLSIDSNFTVSIIKKMMGSNYFLSASKKLQGDLQSNTIHLSNQLNKYIVSGIWENSFKNALLHNKNYKTGLYTWCVNNKLDDSPGDTILYNDSAIISKILFVKNNSNKETNNLFAVQTSLNSFLNSTETSGGNYFDPQLQSTNAPENQPFITEIERMVGPLPSSHGSDVYMPHNQPQVTSSSYLPISGNANQTLRPLRTQYSISNFSIFNLDSLNKVDWITDLKNHLDSSEMLYLNEGKIVAGKKGIHILYPSLATKNKYTIEHIFISYSGEYEKINSIAWNFKYLNLVSQAVEINDGVLIIPCINQNRLIFAKMVLK